MKWPLLIVAAAVSLAAPGGGPGEVPRRPDVTETRSGVLEPALADLPDAAVPLPLALPHVERLVHRGSVDDPTGSAFAVRLAPPDVLHVVTAAGEGARGGLVVDVLQRRGALGTVRVATFGTAEVGKPAAALDVRWAPPVEGEYVVRVGAVPGTVGAFAIALLSRPPLGFPVATDSADAVRSYFGDVRDGGARDHHGIDIFAPRGTPVLAAADGIVARVGDSVRGGLHVWQRAENDAGDRLGSLYYAHLDSVAVLAGTRVARGDVLGTVGNTGNARTTPPHLHFGLYRRFRGPEDPLPLVGTTRVDVPAMEPGHALATWLAVASPALNVRAGPGTGFDVVARLAEGALVRVLGVSGRWARVRVRPDGDEARDGASGEVGDEASDGASNGAGGEARDGFVATRLLTAPVGSAFRREDPVRLLAEPADGAPRLTTIEAGTPLETFGRFGRFRRVETDDGATGWLLDAVAPAAAIDGASSDG